MKIKATLIAIIISVAVIASVSMITASKQNDQTVHYTQTITVKNGQIENTVNKSTYFNPVGDKCSFMIGISGPDEFITDVKIITEMPNNEPIYKASATNTTLSTGELNVNDKGIFVMITPELKNGASLEYEDYSISYTIILHSEGTSGFRNGMIFVVAAAILAFAVFVIISVNRSYNKEYDERQIRVRGAAAMNALLVTVISLFGIGFISYTVENFSFTVYECAIMVTMIGVATFSIIADINDAYIGIKGKRFPLAIVFTLVGLMNLLMSGFYKLVFDMGTGSELKVSSFVTGICLFVMGIEMIIKGISEKRQAKAEEAEDEELKA